MNAPVQLQPDLIFQQDKSVYLTYKEYFDNGRNKTGSNVKRLVHQI